MVALYHITRRSGTLDSDWPIVTFKCMILPDNKRSKLIIHGNPDAANQLTGAV